MATGLRLSTILVLAIACRVICAQYVVIQLTEDVNSRTARNGQVFHGTVALEAHFNSGTIIPANSVASLKLVPDPVDRRNTMIMLDSININGAKIFVSPQNIGLLVDSTGHDLPMSELLQLINRNITTSGQTVVLEAGRYVRFGAYIDKNRPSLSQAQSNVSPTGSTGIASFNTTDEAVAHARTESNPKAIICGPLPSGVPICTVPYTWLHSVGNSSSVDAGTVSSQMGSNSVSTQYGTIVLHDKPPGTDDVISGAYFYKQDERTYKCDPPSPIMKAAHVLQPKCNLVDLKPPTTPPAVAPPEPKPNYTIENARVVFVRLDEPVYSHGGKPDRMYKATVIWAHTGILNAGTNATVPPGTKVDLSVYVGGMLIGNMGLTAKALIVNGKRIQREGGGPCQFRSATESHLRDTDIAKFYSGGLELDQIMRVPVGTHLLCTF